MAKKEVTNLGEALSVFVQIAGLAQKGGILSFDDSVIAKSAIDFVEELAKQHANENQQPSNEQEIQVMSKEQYDAEIASTTATKSRRKAATK